MSSLLNVTNNIVFENVETPSFEFFHFLDTPYHFFLNNVDEKTKTKKQSLKEKQTKQPLNLTHSIYFTQNINLNKYQTQDLKNIAKKHKLHISGTKKALMERISTHFFKEKKCIFIQKRFRGYIVRLSFALRGRGLMKKEICANETDFYTFEPIQNIAHELFFSYTDENNHTYGFNIISLLLLYVNNAGIIANPYNRSEINSSVKKNIFKLYKIIKTHFSHAIENEYKYLFYSEKSKIKKRRRVRRRLDPPHPPHTPPHTPPHDVIIVENDDDYDNDMEDEVHGFSLENTLQNMRGDGVSEYDNHISTMIQKMEALKNTNIHQRIIWLFMEMEQLGNYVEPTWFSRLNKLEYLRLYDSLCEIWEHRGGIPNDVKKRICPLGDPFLSVENPFSYSLQEVSFQRMQEICTTIFEHLVYTSMDIEHRKLGTLHCLTALTVVSLNARNSMYWLYESIY